MNEMTFTRTLFSELSRFLFLVLFLILAVFWFHVVD